jgi:hypothetical protein
MKRTVAAISVLVLLTGLVLAQTPPGPPKPGPEHKRLNYFVGKWSIEGDDKPSPFSPGGKFTGTETVQWFPGGFFLVSRMDGKGPTGIMKGQSVMGYSAEEKAYTFHMIDNMGYQITARGNVSGDTWTWTNDMKMGGKSYKGRFTVTVSSPTAYTVKFEMSTEGGPYTVMMEGKATKMQATKTEGKATN